MNRDHSVYRTFDDEGRCLYVGVTSNLIRRRAQHRSSSPWFPKVTKQVITGPLDREAAYALESAEIERLTPLFNRTKGGGRSGSFTLAIRWDELAKFREAHGLRTDSALADAIRISQGNVSRVLRGKQEPGVKFVQRLCAALDATLGELFEIVPA